MVRFSVVFTRLYSNKTSLLPPLASRVQHSALCVPRPGWACDLNGAPMVAMTMVLRMVVVMMIMLMLVTMMVMIGDKGDGI